MGVEKVSLTAVVGNLFTLRDPFWVASCHLTSNEGAIKARQKFNPAALTLKTCTKNPKKEDEKKTTRYRLADSLDRFGKSTYCDGPKHKELLSYDAAIALLKSAKSHLQE